MLPCSLQYMIWCSLNQSLSPYNMRVLGSSKKKDIINRQRAYKQQRVYGNNNNHQHHNNNNYYYEPNYGPSNHNYHNYNHNNLMMNCHFDRMIMNQEMTNRCEQTGLNNKHSSVENYWTSIAFHRPQDSLFGNSILPILPRICLN
ncbi:GATA zinc finger domain-containing protein 14-like [Panonychus citri]|uniref:GATA zinc finger domain-containing protein 14-like n=1 Tax=Panonychus citri TaxID=50023 RepID=UPI0023081DCB|nr:GATA zinc finger domain-containing protein 14-like [Panonychus citri]